MNRETRQALIDAGIIIPGSRPDTELTLLRLPPERVVLRLDDAARGVAARDVQRGGFANGVPPNVGDDVIARWRSGPRQRRRAA